MAVLNSKEKLIREAAKSNDTFLYSVFKRFYDHFRAEKNTKRKVYDDCRNIDFLYCQDHSGLTFEQIADFVLNMALSTLEDRRALYVSIFYFYFEDEQAKREIASTSNL